MSGEAIEVVEVGPRDGLQNEAEVLPVETRLDLIHRMIGYGARRLEVASFVDPARVPQMAEAEAVVAGLPDLADRTYVGLALNMRGVMRALGTRAKGARGVDQVGCVVSASDSFGQRNQGRTIAESLAETRAMLRLARAEGLGAQVTIAVAFGCPFEGAVGHERVLAIAADLAAEGPLEIALADTIGIAAPREVGDLFGRLAELLGRAIPLRAHFHDTRGTGLANAWEVYRAGVRIFDASLGGLGGCPFAPGAAGNIATEDLVYMMERAGAATGIDLGEAIAANRWLAGRLGRDLRAAAARAA